MTSHFPSNSPRERCRSCKKPILWALTENGRRIPIDPEPVENGNILLQHRPANIPLAVYQTKEMLAALHEHGGLQQYRLYLSHFVSCPQAKGWRKPQKHE